MVPRAGSEVELDNLARDRRKIKRQISRIKDYLTEWSKPNVPNAEERCDLLMTEMAELRKEFASKVDATFCLIEDGPEKKAQEEAILKEDDEVRAIVVTTIAKVKGAIKSMVESSRRDSLLNCSNPTAPPNPSTKLPKISVPKFDGDIRKFLKFKGLFENIIHEDPDIPNVRKLYYLQEALAEGKAEPLIRDIVISDASYDAAWKRVLNKFDSKRQIIRAYFDDLFSIKPIKDEYSLTDLIDNIEVCLGGLRLCGEEPENWSSILSYFVRAKLDPTTKKDFDNSMEDRNEFPSYKTLMKFLENRASSVEERRSSKTEEKSKSKAESTDRSLRSKKVVAAATAVPTPQPVAIQQKQRLKPKCVACNEMHRMVDCQVFKAKSPRERFELVQTNRLCLNCFVWGHMAADCRGLSCRLCGKKHHTLLHFETAFAQKPESNNWSQPESKSNSSESSQTDSKVCSHVISDKFVILATAVVKFEAGNRRGSARVFIDMGSQVTLISDLFVRQHRLRTSKGASLGIEGVGDNPVQSSGVCTLTLLSRFGDFSLEVSGEVVPSRAFKYKAPLGVFGKLQDQFPSLHIAESRELNYENIDVIIGAEHIESILLNQTLSVEALTLRNTRFGWIATGRADGTNSSNASYAVCNTVTLRSIEDKLKILCDSDDFDRKSAEDAEHEAAEKFFEDTYSRDETGRFIVRYPIKGNVELLSDTRRMASKSIDRIFEKPGNVLSEYHKFIKKYVDLGHMSLIPISEDKSSSKYFLPQLLVIREDKTTTKMRVVFHASFKVANRLSLNDVLMTGPCIQPDLFDIILRFRRHPVAFTADIEKMYRQVRVHDEDQYLQKILYRNENNEWFVGVLSTVTYGTAPASFLATKCLAVLANEICEENPRCADAIGSDFYMDDLMTGGSNVAETIELKNQICCALESAHFPLRKFCSNYDKLLDSLPSHLKETVNDHEFETGNVKVLGLRWYPRRDKLGIVLRKRDLLEPLTKRVMLSEIASVFDVLGVLSPVTIAAKLQMQELWKIKISWDDELPNQIRDRFLNFYSDLSNLSEFTFDRHYAFCQSGKPYELIGFCDSSAKAYCSVVYLRLTNSNHEPAVSFLCAKTRVAPLKQSTIPRLELQAAHLLAKLIEKIQKIFRYPPLTVYAFSDSTTVLYWLRKGPSVWKTFVANRVRDVIAVVPENQWHYVKTSENPADLATRGVSAKLFLSKPLWMQGPLFITENPIPLSCISFEQNREALAEQKTSASFTITSQGTPVLERFSSYLRLLHAVAYMLRFVRRRRAPSVHLEADEISNARTFILRTIQKASYAREMYVIKADRFRATRGALSSLNPFVDQKGLLRVGGRLRNSDLPYFSKHPLIVPAASFFTLLYVRYLHDKYFHATKAFIINFVKSEFWPVGNLTSVVKKVIRHCTICIRFRGETIKQALGQLPSVRVSASSAFSACGIDFAGPFQSKCVNHRVTKFNKLYLAVFVCMCTRGVHFEIVSDLTTSCFLDAFKRFIARRGRPSIIYSDNGRTFVGAKNYLDLSCSQVEEFASAEGIAWRFIPPRAPNQGGLWEAAVKSAKYHLSRVVGKQILTFEEYSTFFSQTEAVLNSRPLFSHQVEDKSVVAISPAHLICGRPLLTNIDCDPCQARSLKQRFLLREQMLRSFWKAWRSDYLSQLQRAAEFANAHRELAVGDVVLIKEDNQAPSLWPMGVIEAVYPDQLGHVRVVDVKTITGSYRRTNRSLVPLLPDESTIPQRGENEEREIANRG